jgi:cleavage and polyadenylation specificity factor subunit 3
MQKLKNELILQYEDSTEYSVQVYNPRNTQPVELYFRGEKTAKIVGKLAAMVKAEENARISGVLVKKNFKYQIMLPEDLPNYTDLAVSTVLQRQSVPFSGDAQVLLNTMYKVCGNLDPIKNTKNSERVGVKVYDEIDLYLEKGYVLLEVTDSFPRLITYS